MSARDVGAILAQYDASVVVVDRMLGMGKIVFRSLLLDPSFFVLPPEWVEMHMFITKYPNYSTVRKRRTTDTVMVHCIRKAPFTNVNEALLCLQSLCFPLHLALHVYMRMGGTRRHKMGRSTDSEHLCIIYIHMKSVQSAMGCVPSTDPLVPQWDAVYCAETDSYLHVLQGGEKMFDLRKVKYSTIVPDMEIISLPSANDDMDTNTLLTHTTYREEQVPVSEPVQKPVQVQMQVHVPVHEQARCRCQMQVPVQVQKPVQEQGQMQAQELQEEVYDDVMENTPELLDSDAVDCIPGTDPLVPKWDAVYCAETDSYLHVLQGGETLFNPRRVKDSIRLSQKVQEPVAEPVQVPVQELQEEVCDSWDTPKTPITYVLRKTPGWMSVRDIRMILAQYDASVVVIDRMLRMRKVVFRSLLPRPSLFVLPQEWVERGMSIVVQNASNPKKKDRRESDVIMVHCIRKARFADNYEALLCLKSVHFPLILARHVYTQITETHQNQKSILAPFSRPEYLCIIYVHMKSVQSAMGCVPSTDPLVPQWDAVYCAETDSYLHVLQYSDKPFDAEGLNGMYITLPETANADNANTLAARINHQALRELQEEQESCEDTTEAPEELHNLDASSRERDEETGSESEDDDLTWVFKPTRTCR